MPESISKKLTISFEPNFLFGEKPQTALITAATQTATAEKIATATSAVEKKLTEKTYGFVEVLSEQSYIDEVKTIFEKVRWAKTLVVVGIGGSDLGARAVQQALESDNPPMTVLFHGDSTDPVAIEKLLKKIELSSTVFNIISKSGQTVETAAQYLFFRNLYKQFGAEWQKHFLFTTDPKDGILRAEAAAGEILTLPIPPNVGGRFSVLTPVGLLPALAMGIDIEQLLVGAREFVESVEARVLTQQLAATQFQLYSQGTKVVVFMPYSIQLEEFARWFRQLWAESLGKDGRGILPIQARGPADQHSQLQFYNEGEPLQSLLFLRVEERKNNYSLNDIDLDEVQYLNGHSFHEIVNIEQTATALSLKKNGRPSATLSLAELNAYSLGQLFAFFELAVVYLAEMLEVNAFDQPGVEESKNMMYALLGRAGYEAKKEEIAALQK